MLVRRDDGKTRLLRVSKPDAESLVLDTLPGCFGRARTYKSKEVVKMTMRFD